MDKIAEWLSAIGTIGAFAVSLWLLWEQIKESKKRRLVEQSNTAKHVSAWCDLTDDSATLWVQNLSKEPVYYLVAYIGKFGTNLELLPEPDNMYMEPVFGTVPPEAKLDFVVDKEFVTGERFPDIPEVAIEFTDTEGVHWRRNSNGKLKQIEYRRPFD